MISPDREEFHRLAGTYRVIPVWRELLADFITPVAAFARLCGDETPGFLFESVEHGERWSRWSFVGRNPIATLTLQNGIINVEGSAPEGMPTDKGMLSAIDYLLSEYSSVENDALPPLHSGVVGYLGYDVVREVEHLPSVPTDVNAYPDAVMSIIGEVAAFDHFRQRVCLIVNAIVPENADAQQIDALYDESLSKLAQLASDGAAAIDEPMVTPPEPNPELPQVQRSFSLDP